MGVCSIFLEDLDVQEVVNHTNLKNLKQLTYLHYVIEYTRIQRKEPYVYSDHREAYK